MERGIWRWREAYVDGEMERGIWRWRDVEGNWYLEIYLEGKGNVSVIFKAFFLIV